MDLPIDTTKPAPKPRAKPRAKVPKAEPAAQVPLPQRSSAEHGVRGAEPSVNRTVPHPGPTEPAVAHALVCNKNYCDHCGMKQKKPRKQSAPTDKQVESRKQFAEKVAAAKLLQVQEPGLAYK